MEAEWIAAATKAREFAYAPYSDFAVGAALIAEDGRIFTGCNVENLSFGLTMCAERVAVGKAVAEGVRNFSAIAIVARTSEPVSPCGACRQVLAQFASGMRVILATLDGKIEEWTLDQLLPRPSTGILDRP
ncbi:MAG: cytidine deaminase [Chthoniobacterales bacterium]